MEGQPPETLKKKKKFVSVGQLIPAGKINKTPIEHMSPLQAPISFF